jgi:glycine/D-amino acid oxidase-like deaminating enzyme
VSTAADIAIVGGGIVGCAAAAFLTEAGAKVEVYERHEVGAAASGRNSGSVQHPFDPVMTELHAETLELYRGLDGLDLPEAPAGVLMLARERSLLAPAADEIARQSPELDARLLEPAALRELEPGLAEGLWGCRLETGYPVRPIAATRAFARRAFSGGARFHEGETAWPWVTDSRARGVLAAGVRRPAGAVLVTAGPWTPEVIDPTRAWQPIVPVWGVVADVQMDDPPQHVLEEVGVEELSASGDGAGAGAIFSLVKAGRQISLGSTFLSEQPPEPRVWTSRLQLAGQRFVPGLRRALVVGARACARPQSLDGRPLVGELPRVEGLWAAAGHGPWGISTGPATARIAADALLGRAAIPGSLSVGRF